MSSGNLWKDDLFNIYHFVQASMIVYPKEIFVATLRDFFSHSSYYSFTKDNFGFANTTDHTDLPLGADIPHGPGAQPQLNPSPILPTRLFIGENYRYDSIFYPAILVKSGGMRYVPISINRNQGDIKYDKRIYVDGYGNQSIVRTPVAFLTNGAFEGSIIVDVLTRSLRSRDELLELVAMCFTEVHFETLHQIGIVVKPVSISATTETDDRNDKLFRQTLTFDIRCEWERAVPIKNTIDAILFSIEFRDLANPHSPVAANLTINTEVNLTDLIIGL